MIFKESVDSSWQFFKRLTSLFGKVVDLGLNLSVHGISCNIIPPAAIYHGGETLAALTWRKR
jgi:hypothetical protein